MELDPRLIGVLAGQRPVVARTSFTPQTHLVTDLGFDSIGVVELTMAVEDEFGVVFTEEETVSLQTAGDLQTVLTKKLESRESISA